MIKSMTGYGLATGDFARAKFTVEIKSLNSKFLELSLKLPKSFSDREFFLRNECNKQIERGKVNVSINAEYFDEGAGAAKINKELIKHYFKQIRETAISLGEDPRNLLIPVMNMPDVVQHNEQTANEEDWNELYKIFQTAIANFQKFRKDEGGVLEDDLKLRIRNIVNGLENVIKQEPNRLPVVKDRINQYLNDAVGKENIDQNRFEQELIYYIEKFDIQEEKIRLKSHCDYFLATLEDKDANGKKLGFISQEIGREINTLGSKANDAQIQQLVIGMKEELEKIKEQLLNVL